MTGKRLGANRPEDRALQERCITNDSMFIGGGFYNNYHQIVQAPAFETACHEGNDGLASILAGARATQKR